MIDAHLHADWDSFWASVEEYAKENNLTTRYVEEEFVIDGELVENYKIRS